MWEKYCKLPRDVDDDDVAFWFSATVVENFGYLPPVLAQTPQQWCIHTCQRTPLLTVGKGGTDCLFMLTTNCHSASLMFLQYVEKETGKAGLPEVKGKKTGDAE